MKEGAGDAVHVLHVDDDEGLLELAAELLEREAEELSVSTASNGEEALAMLRGNEFDCVVSDYDMREMDGLELLERVREIDAEVPFILFTGKGSEEIASQAISSGVTDYLQKHGGREQYEILANRVRNAVEAYRGKRKLSERTRKLETLIDNLPGMVYRCRNEPDWPMEHVEGECRQLTGYSAEELESGEVSWGDDVLHPEERDRAWQMVQEGLEEDGTFEITYRIVREDDRVRWMWESGTGVYIDGELEAIEGFITDVTERKRRERELKRKNRRMYDLANIVSSDLEGEIEVAQSRLERVQEKHGNGDVDSTVESLGRLEDLADDLVQILEQGEAVEEFTDVGLEEASEEAWRNVDSSTAYLDVSTDKVVQAEGSRLQQLLENVFRNTVEHAGEDAVVMVGEIEDGFYVEDDGLGVPEAEMDAVFDAGYTTKDDEHRGYGLLVVEEITDAHGWQLEVAEAPTGGFRLEFRDVEKA